MLTPVAAVGDRLQSLRTLRDILAGEIDDCTSKRDMAALTQRFMDVLEQIEALEKSKPAKEATALDELAAKRKQRSPRGADASRRAHPAGKKIGS